MSLHNLIANGGVVVIIGGMNKSWESYRSHPQLKFWTGEQKDVIRHLANGELPSNAKAIIISRFISHAQLGKIQDIARRRHLTVFPNLNDGEVAKKLEEIVSKPVEIVRLVPKLEPTTAPVSAIVQPPRTKTGSLARGVLKGFVEKHIGADGTCVVEAKRLMPIAKAIGIETTVNSMEQIVRKVRASLGLSQAGKKVPTPPPLIISKPPSKPVPPPAASPPAAPPPSIIAKSIASSDLPEVSALVAMLEDAVAALTLIKEEVAKLQSQGAELAALKAKLADLIR